MYGSASQSPASSRPADSGRSTSESTTNGVRNNGYSLPVAGPHDTTGYLTSSGPLAGVNPLGTALLHSYAPALNHAPKSHLAPAAFQGRKPRSGKWIKEEEEYADLLINLFERGQVEDCENGCTLRSFLSRKLHCAPMRISKKYAGKGIGKMVFLSKLSVGIISLPGEDHEETSARVKVTEEKFYHAVFPGSEYRDPFEARAATAPLHPGILPTRFPFQIPMFNPENFSKPMSPVIAPKLTMGAATAPESSADQAKLLHQSFMNALKQKPPTAVAADLAPQATPIGASHTSQVGCTQHAQASSSMGAGERPPLSRSALSWVPSESAKPRHANASFSSLPVHPLGTAPQTNELPDLLAGFDNFASNFKHGDAKVLPTAYAPPTTDGNHEYSPSFTTSQSFDDFHRLLGNDLSPLDVTADQKTSSSSTRDLRQAHSSLAATTQVSQSIREIDTMALFSAESYAMFAQESAIAASQHAAYFQVGDLGFASSIASRDAEGLMSVISGQMEDRQRYASQRNGQPKPSQAISLAGAPISTNGLTPVERLYGARDVNVVSGSEPSNSTETGSSNLSMLESLSDRGVSDNTSNGCNSDNVSSNDYDSGSVSSDCQSDGSPQRKKLKRTSATAAKRDRGAEHS